MKPTAGRMFAHWSRWTAVALALGMALSTSVDHAFAAGPLHITTNLYPAHTHITVLDPLSNAQMDCDWSFACPDGQPLIYSWIFHLQTEDALHRVSGWAQLGESGVSVHHIVFAVFASRYGGESGDGLPWNVAAFADFRGAVEDNGYLDLTRVPRLTPSGMVGNASVLILRSPSHDIIAMACWVGSVEVEGIAIYGHGMAAQRKTATASLTRQMRAAVLAALQPA